MTEESVSKVGLPCSGMYRENISLLLQCLWLRVFWRAWVTCRPSAHLKFTCVMAGSGLMIFLFANQALNVLKMR